MINTMFRNDDAMMTPIFLLFHIMHPKKRQTLFHKNVLQRKKIAFDLGFQNECSGARAHFE